MVLDRPRPQRSLSGAGSIDEAEVAKFSRMAARWWDPTGEIESAIRNTALEYQLMSEFTSFVAVDSSYRTEGTQGTTVHQAVPVPEGVRYETTVDPREEP